MNTPRLLLLLGDLAVLSTFAVLGRRTHAEAVGFGAALEVATTAAPFLIAWLVTAPVLGALSEERLTDPRTMLTSTLRAWLVAFPIAVLLRALLLGRPSPWTFYMVAFTASVAMLLAWRLVFALLSGRRRRAAS